MPKREKRRGVTREKLESKELKLPPPGPVPLPLARPSINQTESPRTGRGLKRNPRGGETGAWSQGAAATTGSRTPSPGPSSPKSTPLSSAPEFRPPALYPLQARARHPQAPARARSRGHLQPLDLPPVATPTPAFCDVGWGPTPLRTELEKGVLVFKPRGLELSASEGVAG